MSNARGTRGTRGAKEIAGRDGSYYNAMGEAISYNAYHALYAARLRTQIGRWMARQYIIRRGVPASLYRLACQLVAVEAGEQKRA